MDKETELNILTKHLEELQAINQELAVIHEKTINHLKEGGSLSEQFIKTKSDYQLSVLTYEAENYLKMFDIFIDILKFLIPTLVSIWTVTHIVPQFSGASNFALVAFLVCIFLLAIVIIIRMWKVNSYVSKFREEQKNFIVEYFKWQIQMEEVRALELDNLKKSIDLLKEQYEELVSGKQKRAPI